MKRLLLIAATLYCSTLFAGPAPWYRWQGPEGGVALCSQNPPGDGWIIVKGPYRDALCKEQGMPG